MKKLSLILIVFTLYNCKPQKIYIETIKTERDSIYINKVIKEVERFTDTLTIEQPCDSLGNLKPFFRTIKVPQGQYTLKGVNNVITADLDLKGYKEILEKEYQSKLKENSKIEKQTIYKTPLKYWLFIGFSFLLNLTFLYLIFKKR